ncbi:MAG: ubiquinone biosynthesis regulatory protein kinase UbiB [Gammaproteobacteria bacterium]|nr:MAG: ubiquinone biosynthesis regulatory protein kinase UbiB [Gammaproteobacteria bacterium]
MLKKFRLFLRLLHIQWIFVRYRLDVFLHAVPFLRPIHWVMRLFFLLMGVTPRESDAIRLRKALERLGPVFIKFGQNLSTRRDLLNPELADELAKLQDNVPPFPGTEAKKIIEQELSEPINTVFAHFDDEPFASASIAQVHRAVLKSGESVVVKVVRPGIEKTIDRDMALLYILADLANRYWKESRRLKPREVVKEFDRVIHDELDLVREAANASQLRRNFEQSPLLYVPEVFWPYTRRRVMVMEEIKGIAIDNIDEIKAQNIDLKTLSENGVEIFYTQVFRDNFFHADMHPGNIFTDKNGRYIAVDFGIMGSLSHEDQRYLAENFLAFFNRDYRRVAELHVESGWVPAGTRVEAFESAIRTVCEPIFERPLKEISFGRLLLQLFLTVRQFNMEIQPQLLLLQKTLLNIEGLGRQLYPDLDLWKTAKPFLEKWMSERIGYRSVLKEIRKNSVYWGEQIPQLPGLVYRFLKHNELPAAQRQTVKIEDERSSARTTVAILSGSCLIAASILLASGQLSLRPIIIGGYALGTVLGITAVQTKFFFKR